MLAFGDLSTSFDEVIAYKNITISLAPRLWVVNPGSVVRKIKLDGLVTFELIYL